MCATMQCRELQQYIAACSLISAAPQPQHQTCGACTCRLHDSNAERKDAAPAFLHRCCPVTASTQPQKRPNKPAPTHTFSTLHHRLMPQPSALLYSLGQSPCPACLPHNAHPKPNAASAMHNNWQRDASAAAQKKRVAKPSATNTPHNC